MLHKTVQHLVKAVMKLGGISAVKEAAKFLSNKVGEPFISLYLDHLSRSDKLRNSPFAIIGLPHLQLPGGVPAC